MLTRDRKEIATEPQQKEARELFAMWKITANDDGTIGETDSFAYSSITWVAGTTQASWDVTKNAAL